MIDQERINRERQKAIDLVSLKQKANIDADYVSDLVDLFYSRVRENPVIGPIFEEKIGDDWKDHLATMKSFWESVATSRKSYSGNPLAKHQALDNMLPWHFNIWLALFEQSLEDTAPNEDTVTYFMESANRVARSFKMAIFNDDSPLAI